MEQCYAQVCFWSNGVTTDGFVKKENLITTNEAPRICHLNARRVLVCESQLRLYILQVRTVWYNIKVCTHWKDIGFGKTLIRHFPNITELMKGCGLTFFNDSKHFVSFPNFTGKHIFIPSK